MMIFKLFSHLCYLNTKDDKFCHVYFTTLKNAILSEQTFLNVGILLGFAIKFIFSLSRQSLETEKLTTKKLLNILVQALSVANLHCGAVKYSCASCNLHKATWPVLESSPSTYQAIHPGLWLIPPACRKR